MQRNSLGLHAAKKRHDEVWYSLVSLHACWGISVLPVGKNHGAQRFCKPGVQLWELGLKVPSQSTGGLADIFSCAMLSCGVPCWESFNSDFGPCGLRRKLRELTNISRYIYSPFWLSLHKRMTQSMASPLLLVGQAISKSINVNERSPLIFVEFGLNPK